MAPYCALDSVDCAREGVSCLDRLRSARAGLSPLYTNRVRLVTIRAQVAVSGVHEFCVCMHFGSCRVRCVQARINRSITSRGATLFPTMAFAQPENAICNLVDQKALSALGLGVHKTTVKRGEGSKTPHQLTQATDSCTITPPYGGLPTLSVSTGVVAMRSTTVSKPACHSSPLPSMALYECTLIERNNFVVVILLTKGSPDVAMEGTFRAQVERLFGGDAGENSKGAVAP